MIKLRKALLSILIPIAITTTTISASCGTQSPAKKLFIEKILKLEELTKEFSGAQLESINNEIKSARNILNNAEAKDADFLMWISRLDAFINSLLNNQNDKNNSNSNQKKNDPKNPETKPEDEDNTPKNPDQKPKNDENSKTKPENLDKYEPHEDHSTRNSNIKDANTSESYYSLNDEYLMDSNYQQYSGLCWSFASTRALESTLLKHQNELYKISEAGFDLPRVRSIGTGGDFGDITYSLVGVRDFWNSEMLTKKYNNVNGFLLENDFPFESLWFANQKNRALFNNHLKKRYIRNSNLLIKPVFYNVNDVENIKKHLKVNGALRANIIHYASYKDSQSSQKANASNQTTFLSEIAYLSKGTNSGHAVAIIGWDDNYEIPGYGKGAWIIRDSTSHNKITYLPYNFHNAPNLIINSGQEIMGFEYRKPKVLISSSESKINITSGSANSTKNFKTETKESKTTNVFEWKKGVNIKYEVNDSIAKNFKMNSIKISNSGKNVSNLFEIIETNNKSFTIKSKDNNIAHGSYRVDLDYEYVDIETNKVVKFTEVRQIFVWTYAGRVYQDVFSYSNKNSNLPKVQGFYSFAHNNREFSVFSYSGDSTYLNYYYSPETKVSYFKVNDKQAKSDVKTKFNYLQNELRQAGQEEKEEIYNIKLYDKNDNLLEENKVRMFSMKRDYGSNLFALLAIGNGGNDNYQNQYIYRAFNNQTNSIFNKYKLVRPQDNNFVRYVYYDADRIKKELPKDKNGDYYIDYELVSKNYYDDYNFMTANNRLSQRHYKYTIFIEPEYKDK
ncbi:Uncharacterised protein [Metamycoplasma arthritidis]|uniref:Cysteine protease n=1 Tax=Metamycoplasma arthritidis (strain 158L3-1) TaxID=243272 RepID=B3PMH9_META1|nr:C1 family peptidase [Metamycoplasma arthritidis]ACF07231.1 cysteine protease [Metamycoplasma arthritidis 158L3-1]VEU78755.1 Uncharacterised protein [Metamycoplasma arthritidis]